MSNKKKNPVPLDETEVTEVTEVTGEEAEVTEVTEVTEEVKEVEQAAPVSKMYMGPNIPHVVMFGTVFKDGIYHDALNKCIERIPLIKHLLIDIDKTPKAFSELKNPNSTLSAIKREVTKKL